MGNLISYLLETSPPLSLFAIVIAYISKLSPQHAQLISDFLRTKRSEIRDLLQRLVSLGQDLKVFFAVTNKQILSTFTPIPTLDPNQVLVAFVNFLRGMTETILYVETSLNQNLSMELKFLVENLEIELAFLVTFLGDTPMLLLPTPTKNIMIEIEAVVNAVGSFIFSYFFTTMVHIEMARPDNIEFYKSMDFEAVLNEVGGFLHSDSLLVQQQTTDSEVEEIENVMTESKEMVLKVRGFIDFFVSGEGNQVPEGRILELALSNLLPKFELLKTKIKEHCLAVLKISGDRMAPNTAVVSLFIVDLVLDDLMYLINNKSHMTDGVDDQIVRLHEEFMLLGTSVNKIASQLEAEHEELIVRTRDVAYEVEYVINSFPPIWYLALRLPRLIGKIQQVKLDVEEAKAKIDVARETRIERFSGEQASLQSKQTPVFEDNIMGFKQVEKEIMEQLVGGTEHCQIISIFGMPGLGKTTLAHKLYNHKSVVKRFDCRAWCVSSQTYNKRNMLIDILISIGRLKREDIEKIKKDEDLGEKVYKFIKGRRYLFVIDDIWDINAWYDLRRYFPDDGTGSRILLTTRNKEVGLQASTNHVVKELLFLSDVECWELLKWKVFQDGDCPQELLDIGKKIASKCQGLPLSVVVVAGVLANMEMKQHSWQKVESNLSSYIAESPDNCMQILTLSYKHLPLHLKPCFLYLGSFKEDAEIPIRKLIGLWVAEGFIKREDQKSLEDVALAYLEQLIDRSLVLVSKKGSNGNIKTCKIHDLLLEMCLKIAEENYFLKLLKFNDDHQAMYPEHHYLSIAYEDIKPPTYISNFGPHVRSLSCSAAFPVLLLHTFKVLRVLKVYKSFKPSFVGIKHLVNLRYLAISICKSLPPIENFHRLEFLNVDNYEEVEITEVLLNMVSLRSMHFRGGSYFSASCRQKVTEEESFKVKNEVLQSISEINISDETDEKILRCFPSLCRLKGKLSGSTNFSFDVFNEMECLKLSTHYTRPSFSNLINLPSNLKQLTLVARYASHEQMEMIGILEYLEVLKLDKIKFQGEEWNTSDDAFPQLKVLKLNSVGISKWNASSGCFSSLERLVLRECKHLKVIPSSFGEIAVLQKIELIHCPKALKESAKKIEKHQKEEGNEELQLLVAEKVNIFLSIFLFLLLKFWKLVREKLMFYIFPLVLLGISYYLEIDIL